MANKIKINKTNRILVKSGTIYCSSEMVRELRPFLMRVEQRFAPLKGKMLELEGRMRELMRLKPDHFSNTSKIIMGVE